MSKSFKRLMGLFIAMVMCLGISAYTFAAEASSPYKEILNEVNEKYSLNLGYVPVDEAKVSLKEYEAMSYQFAAEQRALLDYIASRKTSSSLVAARSAVVKTKTKPTWTMGQDFTIRATYTVYDGSRISKCRNASLNMTNIAIIKGIYLSNISSPSYTVIDSGRTSTVRYNATVNFSNGVSYSNTTLYTEFYYSE